MTKKAEGKTGTKTGKRKLKKVEAQRKGLNKEKVKKEYSQNPRNEVLEDLNMDDLFNNDENGENIDLLAKYTEGMNLSSNTDSPDVNHSNSAPGDSDTSKEPRNIQGTTIETSNDERIKAKEPVDKQGESSNQIKREEMPLKRNFLYVPITTFVTESTDLSKLVFDNFPSQPSNVPNSKQCNCDKTISESSRGQNTSKYYIPNPSCDDDVSAKSSHEQIGSDIMLTGLHTCGDLAPSMMRIFLANENARILCNVGCCYHLLNEEFSLDKNGELKGNFYSHFVIRRDIGMLFNPVDWLGVNFQSLNKS